MSHRELPVPDYDPPPSPPGPPDTHPWSAAIDELVERIKFLEEHVHGVNFIDKTTPPQSGGSR